MLKAFLSPTPLTPALSQSRQKGCSTSPRTQPRCSDQPDPTTGQQKRRRAMSPEARAKISAALRGRRKSDEHRENLRRRFGGIQNPMYGRKLSAESRAKISRAMAARKQKKTEDVPKEELDEEMLDRLREKAKTSRLLESPKERHRRPGRRLIDERESKEMDKVLERVARLDEPPESVVKMILNTEKRRRLRLGGQTEGMNGKQEQDEKKCGACKGSGMVRCPECVGVFGVASTRCETCFGTGATFCAACEGAGSAVEKS